MNHQTHVSSITGFGTLPDEATIPVSYAWSMFPIWSW